MKKIKILHLEDASRDSELISSAIETGGISHEYFLVDNEKDFLNILENENIDLVLSDQSLPDYDGNEALRVVREKYSHIPFIFVSGTMGEDTSFNTMSRGATDYVLKDKLERLVPVIKRAMKEQELITKRKLAESKLTVAKTQIAFQSGEKEKRADELRIADKELAFQSGEKEKRADELRIADIELAYQSGEKENRAAELLIANKELVFQNEEKEKRAAELLIANEELIFQNKEKENRAAELLIANQELAFQNEEKEKRAAELLIANEELVFQNEEKEKRAAELSIANEELAYQNEEKEKRAAELIIANKELAFQNVEKEKRAAELLIANKELIFQNEEKEKRAVELSKAKEKAEESDKLKTAFLQNMSHEIRTPLNGIIGFSGLLNSENLSKEDIKDFTSMISQSGQRLIEIVNNVLDISKIQIGQIQIEKKPIIINSIFSDLFTFFSHIAEEKNIVLNFQNKDEQYVTIFSDETKLNQILTNLINNAIKFTKSGSIDFGYEIKDNIIQLYVKDTGTGIPPEFFDRIFERFTQADLSITRGYEGAGLGLAICKGLVELLGGKIWLESEVNKGTTFFFTLPHTDDTDIELNSRAETIILNSPQNSTDLVKQTKGKILIAEDDRMSFQYLNKLLENADVTVIHAEDGAQAVELVRNNPDIDLILMDIRMPVMDGMEATKLIKQIRPDLPIIAQTAYAFSEEKERILASGCDEYLAKPIKNDMLQLFIDKYLN